MVMQLLHRERCLTRQVTRSLLALAVAARILSRALPSLRVVPAPLRSSLVARWFAFALASSYRGGGGGGPVASSSSRESTETRIAGRPARAGPGRAPRNTNAIRVAPHDRHRKRPRYGHSGRDAVGRRVLAATRWRFTPPALPFAFHGTNNFFRPLAFRILVDDIYLPIYLYMYSTSAT